MLKDGCEELYRSTNRWREMRGGSPLKWEFLVQSWDDYFLASSFPVD